VFFIMLSEITPDQKVMYRSFVYTCPNKSKVHRVRMTVGGDQLDTYQDLRSPAVSRCKNASNQCDVEQASRIFNVQICKSINKCAFISGTFHKKF